MCIDFLCKAKTNTKPCQLTVADPEGPLPGGRNQIGAKRRRGRVREGETPSCRWGSGGPPPGKFLKNGCKWCILSPIFAKFVLITSPKIVCNFCPQSSDLRHTCCGKISNLAVEDHIQQKRGVFILLQ